MQRALVPLAMVGMALVGLIPAASAQEITGGCSAQVNGRTLDTLTRTSPLVVAKGDTVDLVGSVPVAAGSGEVSSETTIFVEVVGDIPVATETGTGPTWGGTVTVPNVITQLAPGVYKVKGTAEGSGWICTGSAYVKVEGGPLTAATAIGALVLASGIATAVGSRKPKHGQVFQDAPDPSVPAAGGGVAGPEAVPRLIADGATLGVFALLVALVGYVGPSWVL